MSPVKCTMAIGVEGWKSWSQPPPTPEKSVSSREISIDGRDARMVELQGSCKKPLRHVRAVVPEGVSVILDMHVHTTIGSYDSNLSPLDLIHLGKASGLDGVVVTEHDRGWDRDLARQLTREHDFLILCGMEVSTDLGHILVYGLEEYVSGILYADTLRQVVDKIDGLMFAAHPYRKAFVNTDGRWDAPKPTLTVQEAADRTLVQLVDGLEVYNGATGNRENGLAVAVREQLGVRGIGGSDAHSEHGLGCCATEFERPVRTERELIAELRAGRFRAINRLQKPSSARP